MDCNLSPWLTGRLRSEKSPEKEAIKASASSKVIGRKISSYHRVRPNLMNTSKPIVIQDQSKSSRMRNETISKSRSRSRSQKAAKVDKNLEIPLSSSPPRASKKLKVSKSGMFRLEKLRKSVLTEASYLLSHEKLDKSENSKSVIRELLKEKLKAADKKIRVKNAKGFKKKNSKHPKPWGCDQRVTERSRSNENDELRNKVRAEREVSRKDRRKAIGLELFPEKKLKVKGKEKEKKEKVCKRSPDPNIKKYIKKKNKSRRVAELQKQLEMTLKERERILGLEKLDKTMKKTHKKAPKKTQRLEEKSTELTHSLVNISKLKHKSETKRINKSKHRDPNSFISKHLKKFQSKFNNTQKEHSAIKIQKWFRSLLLKKKLQKFEKTLYTPNSHSTERNHYTENDEWVSFVQPSSNFHDPSIDSVLRANPSSNSSSIQHKILQRLKHPGRFHFENSSNSSNDRYSCNEIDKTSANRNETPRTPEVLSLSALNFQSKRPKALDIDTINTPVQSYYNKTSCDSKRLISEPVSPKFNSSVASQAEPLYQCENSPQDSFKEKHSQELSLQPLPPDAPSEPKPAASTDLIDSDVHSFNIQKLDDEISDKESLEQEICQISSALQLIPNPSPPVAEPLTTSPKSIREDSKPAPATSPSLSHSMTDILLEVLEKEIDLFICETTFDLREKEVNPSFEYISQYLSSLYEILKPFECEVLESLNTPAFIDPLLKMNILQNTEIGELNKQPAFDLLLPAELCSKLKQSLGKSYETRKVYLKLLFDVVNEAMNQIRPFGLKGVPDPWTSHASLLFGEGELKQVFTKVEIILKRWAGIRSGAYPDREMLDDEEKCQRLREERMSSLLCYDSGVEAKGWVEYSDEETQSKFDIAEILFDKIVLEVLEVLEF